MPKSAWKRALVAGAFSLTLCVGGASASADVMPDCEDGQHLETNPVGPDETHHAGGRCVGEPTGCAVRGGGGSPGAVVLLGFAAAALVGRRRR